MASGPLVSPAAVGEIVGLSCTVMSSKYLPGPAPLPTVRWVANAPLEDPLGRAVALLIRSCYWTPQRFTQRSVGWPTARWSGRWKFQNPFTANSLYLHKQHTMTLYCANSLCSPTYYNLKENPNSYTSYFPWVASHVALDLTSRHDAVIPSTQTSLGGCLPCLCSPGSSR